MIYNDFNIPATNRLQSAFLQLQTESGKMNLADLFRHETEDLLSLPAGEALFNLGDPGTVMYVLKTGSVEIRVRGTLVETAEAGALLGEMALIDNSPRAANAIAITDCELVPIDMKRFLFLVQQTPNFSIHVMKVMAQRLRSIDALLK
jgi:CRP/FNR family cyclic AMP-dependent transcriptional regulator